MFLAFPAPVARETKDCVAVAVGVGVGVDVDVDVDVDVVGAFVVDRTHRMLLFANLIDHSCNMSAVASVDASSQMCTEMFSWGYV